MDSSSAPLFPYLSRSSLLFPYQIFLISSKFFYPCIKSFSIFSFKSFLNLFHIFVQPLYIPLKTLSKTIPFFLIHVLFLLLLSHGFHPHSILLKHLSHILQPFHHTNLHTIKTSSYPLPINTPPPSYPLPHHHFNLHQNHTPCPTLCPLKTKPSKHHTTKLPKHP